MTVRIGCLRKSILCVATLLVFLCAIPASAASIGVYYYPGWRDDTLGNRSKFPWDELRAYPDRKPLLGYYAEGNVDVINRQLGWMSDAGIDFVVFDWYWNNRLGALQSHALDAYYQAPNRSLVKHAIMWANHSEFPEAPGEFEKMVRFWRFYFRQPGYLQIDGRPVVIVMSAKQLDEKAKKFGSTAAALLSAGQSIAREEGFPGIYFVGGAGAYSPYVSNNPDPKTAGGYSAFSSYNYHEAGPRVGQNARGLSHSYRELDLGYRDHWNWIVANSKVPYILPMTSGWDVRPWGGSKDAAHDNSLSTPDEFEVHLRAAKAVMDQSPQKTMGMGVICCWNEFGEGSFIEPTEQAGDEYLQRIRRVFGSKASAQRSR